MATFGQRLRLLRDKHGLTQKQISEKLGVSESTIGKYENDQRTPPPDTITTLADYFRVTTDYLLGRDQSPADKIADAIADDKELADFWAELRDREDLQLLFKQTKNLSPATIKRIIKYIKMVEDEEAMED